MVIQGCVKTVLDDSKYSSPVPVIGLYIAVASLACFMAVLFDLLSGCLHRKRWLPCQWFSLNSLTLTMLGVAAKIPVDLTTPMPSALDQFSKLSGTTFLCIAMAFLMPSVGMKQTSECVKNMVALTIFVVTVIVNVCLQIHTGVIFMFVVEHIITMCCLLGFLIVLWTCTEIAISEKESSIDENNDLFTKGKGKESMLERLKVAYLFAFNYNPQIVVCRNVEHQNSTCLCIICSVVLIPAAIKSLSWEFCRGSSDYVWSMWPIVMIQILTIILGSVASIIRYCAFSSRVELKPTTIYTGGIFMICLNPVMTMRTRECGEVVLLSIQSLLMYIVHVSLLLPLTFLRFLGPKLLTFMRFLVSKMFRLCFEDKPNDLKEIDEYQYLIDQCYGGDKKLQKWVLMKAVKELKRCIDENRNESSLHHLSRIHPKKLHPSSDQLHITKLVQNNLVSSLSMVLLVRIAEVSIPPEISATLVEVYQEAYDIIHFVEDRLLSTSILNRKKSKLAKAVWRGMEFRYLLPRRGADLPQPKLDRALMIMDLLNTLLPFDNVRIDMQKIIDIIKDCFDHSSVENLYRIIEESFFYMLHELLVQLPHAIYKEVAESSAEDFDTRVRLCLEILCKVQPIEAHIRWSFPEGCDALGLITARDTVADARIGRDSVAEARTGRDTVADTKIGVADVSNNLSGDVVVEIDEL